MAGVLRAKISTRAIGEITSAFVSMPSKSISLPQLAVHAREDVLGEGGRPAGGHRCMARSIVAASFTRSTPAA